MLVLQLDDLWMGGKPNRLLLRYEEDASFNDNSMLQKQADMGSQACPRNPR